MKGAMIAVAAMVTLAGCAGGGGAETARPEVGGSLEGGPWLVESVDGSATDPAVRADITFEPGDANTSVVFGTGGCNRFRGGWQQTGTAIKLGPLAGTMMMCPPERMAVESKVLKGLDMARTVGFASDGSATLTAPDGGAVKIRREKK